MEVQAPTKAKGKSTKVRPSPTATAGATPVPLTLRTEKRVSNKTLENNKRWLIRYNELAAYKEMHGDCLVPKDFPPNPQLGRWVQNQRLQYKLLENGKPHRLSPFRLDLLKQVGFQYRLRDEWMTRYNELKAHYQKHGTCNVPRRYKENPSLGHFVAKQRFQYKLYQERKHTSMTPERIRLLQEINFDWNVMEAAWMIQYRVLQEYKRLHGNCLLPEIAEYNPTESSTKEKADETSKDQKKWSRLAVWVGHQRLQYRKYLRNPKSSKLSAKRIRMLDSLGFEWNTSQAKWMERFCELGHYGKKHGIGVLPPAGSDLRQWLDFECERAASLSQHCRDLLALLGFETTVAASAAKVLSHPPSGGKDGEDATMTTSASTGSSSQGEETEVEPKKAEGEQVWVDSTPDELEDEEDGHGGEEEEDDDGDHDSLMSTTMTVAGGGTDDKGSAAESNQKKN